MKRMSSVVLFLFGAAYLYGCASSSSTVTHGDAGTDAGGAAASSAACTTLAQARCQKRDTCTQGFYNKTIYPDVVTCQAREQASCETSLAAPNTGTSAQKSLTCANALQSETCDLILASVTADACVPPMGTTADGAPCAFSGQCKTGYCSLPKNAACGTCASQPGVGDSCALTGSCGATLACETASDTCVVVPKPGDACDKTHPCLRDLSCVGATQTAQGQCVLQPSTLGTACDAKRKTLPDCDHSAGLYCDGSPGKCATITLATAAGAECGTIASGAVVACPGSATCIIPSGQSAGLCVPDAADGGACDTANGPACARPARCVVTTASGTAGTCRLLDGAFCK